MENVSLKLQGWEKGFQHSNKGALGFKRVVIITGLGTSVKTPDAFANESLSGQVDKGK